MDNALSQVNFLRENLRSMLEEAGLDEVAIAEKEKELLGVLDGATALSSQVAVMKQREEASKCGAEPPSEVACAQMESDELRGLVQGMNQMDKSLSQLNQLVADPEVLQEVATMTGDVSGGTSTVSEGR